MKLATSLASTALCVSLGLPNLSAAQSTPAVPQADPAMEVVVVRGSRLPESVPGDVKPELVVGTFEIRTTGATTLPELLVTLLPQTQSGVRRGDNKPILLVNGRRVADFSEIRAIPVRAIRRVEVYPEDVALRYGFPADQKVVNLILFGKFSITGITGGIGQSADAERETYDVVLDSTKIDTNGRSVYSFDAQKASGVSEEDLGLSLSPGGIPSIRSILPETETYRFSGAIGRTVGRLGEQGYATLGVDAQSETSQSILSRASTGAQLARDYEATKAKASVTLEGIVKDRRWNTIVSAYSEDEATRTDRADGRARDRTNQQLKGASFDGTLAGPVPGLPAGTGAFNVRTQASTEKLESDYQRGLQAGAEDIDRTKLELSGSFTIPLASRKTAGNPLGDVSLTLNGALASSSDFGGSGGWGTGLNWSPNTELQITTRYSTSEKLPTLEQLGGPQTNIPSASVYDARTGQSVRLDETRGGNGTLLPEQQRDFILGATFAPLQIEGLNLSLTYARNKTEDYIGSIGVNTRAAETAFSSRYQRTSAGTLIGQDTRALNLGDRETETLSFGLSYSRNFGQAPQFLRDIVAKVQKAQEENPDATTLPGGLPPGITPPPGFKPPPGGTPPDFNQLMQAAKIPGGRWNIGLNYAYTLDDTLILKNSGVKLDLLEGDALDTEMGHRHQLTLDGGLNYRGIGGRLAAVWKGESEIATGYGAERLFVEDQATLDLSLFASTDLMPQLNMAVPFLNGAQVRFEINNLTDSARKVTNSAGLVPTAYQSALLEPEGRSFKLSLKKQF
ncbi:TonB-dependent receptor [Aquidulcibacter sp.]|uniref:TonB-dependent receptor n=1 Tax=Aquidulcibacter sp. TaxID=2052990 RepID=UPI0025C37AC0|nr:TonB-dependent receptor [Aquidulcibacter sp.]MCA3692779.1 TonB-dependent receptor [Aquidulcibacter sp.]